MLWWDWTATRRWKLLAVILAVAAMPWLPIGWLTSDWRVLLGGTGLLAILEIVGWFLFVGLWTGRIPLIRGGIDYRRDEAPTWFWIVAAIYAALILFYLWVILVLAGVLPYKF